MAHSLVGRRPMLALGGATLGLVARGTAYAHHGWSWAEDEQIELRGTIREIYIGHPHPTLRVETAEGLWLVELGNPRQTERAGFTEASAAAGDQVLALGNRSRTREDKRLKAVRITVRARTYDIYPERIRAG
ncbi:DUF6152 family protein [Siccirubricoccus sp. KC 17139]|uniref:DUF6152 family protein n=1 Tax=Siccirubricoccus soli TaxID=2899147 RepID=A0ABT1CYV6_9PROT|nr:DUF6152 family protein [Siccirubricoccus soli]MCO6414849.1 DUF6152 family protein [Siccirubricoccus soli]MCP2680979.1 DUF6152 family protein [Siccirubricoccus soli]